jgi:hypothetical protein
MTPYLTEREYKLLYDIKKYAPLAGLVLLAISLLSVHYSKARRSNFQYHAITCVVITTTIQSLFLVIFSFLFDGKEFFCRNNTSGYDKTDGFTFCALESCVWIYLTLATTFAWTLQIVDIFNILILQIDTKGHWKYQTPLIFLVPAIFVLFTLIKGVEGYSGVNVFCLTSSSQYDYDLYVLYLPVIICAVIGLILSTAVFARLLNLHFRSVHVEPSEEQYSDDDRHRTLEAGNSQWLSGSLRQHENITVGPSHKMTILQCLGLFKQPIIFIISMLIIILPATILRSESYFKNDYWINEFSKWVECVFVHYDGTDKSWIESCHEHVSHRANFNSLCWTLFSSCGQSIFVASFFFPQVYYLINEAFGRMPNIRLKVKPSINQLLRGNLVYIEHEVKEVELGNQQKYFDHAGDDPTEGEGMKRILNHPRSFQLRHNKSSSRKSSYHSQVHILESIKEERLSDCDTPINPPIKIVKLDLSTDEPINMNFSDAYACLSKLPPQRLFEKSPESYWLENANVDFDD